MRKKEETGMNMIKDLRKVVVSRIQECTERKEKGEYLDLSALEGHIRALIWVLGWIDFIMWSEG